LRKLNELALRHTSTLARQKFAPERSVGKELDKVDMETDRYFDSASIANEARKAKKISKAMKAYLKQAEDHDKFIKEKTAEFQIGKRHLANMMGADPEHFGQKDIDDAIEYLFPSGLFEKAARPMMKPPEEIYARRRAAEFDETGRPFHYLFYTTRPQFYSILHEAATKLAELDAYQDEMIKKHGVNVEHYEKWSSGGSTWYSSEELEGKLLEKINPPMFDNFVNTLQRLADHPFSNRVNEFLIRNRKPLVAIKQMEETIQEPTYDPETGRSYVQCNGQRKDLRECAVKVWYPGTGKVVINGDKDLLYWRDYLEAREQILFPLQFTDLLMKVDFEASFDEHKSGPVSQAGAVRLGLARCLCSFVSPEMVERMRVAGLLTWDRRRRERKVYGREGARAKFTWKKR